MAELMMETAAPAWWKQRWPWLLMSGPALVVVAASYTGWLAYVHEDALVVGDYYRQGKAINQDLRRDRAAASLGLSVTLNYDAASGVLSGRLLRDGQNQGPAEPLLLHLSHATLPDKDLKLVLKTQEDGSFRTALPVLERSRWLVLVEGARRDWRLAGTWSWPAQSGVMLHADAPEPAEP